MNESKSIALLSNATRMLAEANTIQQAKELKDLAITAADWARRKGLGEEAIHHAKKYAVLAERKLGEMLAATERAKGKRTDLVTTSNQVDDKPTLTDLGITKRESAEAQKLAEMPEEVVAKIAEGKVAKSKAIREVNKAKKQAEQKQAVEIITESARERLASVCDIRCCTMLELLSGPVRPDCIITDPPYPREYLPLYEDLARLSRDIPLVAVMCGQSYLPEIMAMMTKHLTYRWTLAYLTPGGQAVQQWNAKVNAFWKPVLLFGQALDWIGDVCQSRTNDNDKRFHGWGQSESGMADLVERLSRPGDLVCDPFLGGGTTAVCALRLGRRFIGCDVDESCVTATMARCTEEVSHV